MSESISDIPMVNIEIDGQEMQVEQGRMIIEAADDAEITIPRFCYHKKLSVAANCRMCLVELENGRKPMPACATPVAEGMKVFTKSKKALQFQKSVMEFLLINHPLDCPICDQGGECELQDVAMGYGKDVSRYNQGKRSVADKDIGPLIATDLTRCIHCTRCVRFGTEIAGQQEMGMLHRGEHSEIETFLDGNVESELSGNVIDLCPVGALTSKPYRYQARPWELQRMPSIAPHDCVGSNIYGHVRRGQCLRVTPRENESVNEVWLSDRDRFSYEALNNDNRATEPMIKRDGEWENVSWEEAFDHITSRLQKIHGESGPEALAAIASSSSTTEEFYLLQKLMRELGSNNIDHRLRRNDFTNDAGVIGLNGIDCRLEEIEDFDHILMVGGNVRMNQPLIHHRIRKATVNDDESSTSSINPQDFDFHCRRHHKWLVDNDDMPNALTQVVKAVVEMGAPKPSIPGLDALLASVDVSPDAKHIAEKLMKAEQSAVFIGQLALSNHQASLLMSLMVVLKQMVGAKGGLLTPGANSKGATQAGFLPCYGPAGQHLDKPGRNAKALLQEGAGLEAYFLLNSEPGLDSVQGDHASKALKAAQLVVSMTPFVTDYLKEVSTVILPVNAFAETSGSYTNVVGDVQTFQAISKAPGESRPAWKVIRVLANFLKRDGFDFLSSEEVAKELTEKLAAHDIASAALNFEGMHVAKSEAISAVRPIPIYAIDMLVRQAGSLQKTVLMQGKSCVQVSAELAKQHGLEDGDSALVSVGNQSLTCCVKVVSNLAPKTVSINQSVEALMSLGGDGKLELRKA